ncbi:aldehyde ferredoxin oxidoreductase family protein [Desulforhopalus singaporensis]|uniref:Aldehyde:ferredoxin oxidoreductase n=1 Tax=Desulforhopalus singaporensis TaxID=91360 RepID=A0A1H0VWM6_9BACT|nr:aldehyde ferredoxin oxidoreductase family protein [Desulforhopalus singaporensis]SDP82608.1 aldehyde:ferredoxin oxidoreductase [Desulforhopalus singaporensis]
MNGYAGFLLRVDLSSGVCTKESLDKDTLRKFVGGAGYAADLLYKEIGPGIDPLGPENKIVFATSPLSENPVTGGGSVILCFKSPLTNGWGETRCGSDFGPNLRRAGFDFVVIEGKSDGPVFLEIINGTALLRDATDIVGKDVYEKTDWAEARLPAEIKNKSVMTIGQAGEHRVLFASVMSRDRAAGRCGGGAVMGSKNLLAIAVCGDLKIKKADQTAYQKAVKEALSTVKSNELCAGLNEFGTVGDLAANDQDGDWPTKNWRSNSWGNGAKLFDHFQESNLVHPSQCYKGCPIGCGRICEVKDGPYKTPVHEGGEYESLTVFTSYTVNDDMDLAVYCDYLCNKWGIDTISAGAMIAFLMDCSEHGLLTDIDTEGLDLRWENSSIMPQLLEKIAFRDGIGDLLANGVKRAAERIGNGAQKLAIHVKGLEGPAHDPRSGKLLGIAYGTANRGMCHIHPLEGMAYDRGKLDWGMGHYGARNPKILDRWDEAGKGKDCAILQNGMILPDILSTCKFMSYAGITPEHWANILQASTGWDVDGYELVRLGERVVNLQRLFNIREGFSREDDMLPDRLLAGPEFGPYEGNQDCVISNYEALLDEYYIARGWDIKTGTPSREKLSELELADYQ